MKIRFIFLVIGFIAIMAAVGFVAVGTIGYSGLSSNAQSKKVKPRVQEESDQKVETKDGKLTRSVLDRLRLEVDLEDFDSDGDGKLNAAEEENKNKAIDERIVALRKHRLAKYDFNASGVLEPHELEEGKVLFYKSLLELYDKNKNGRLSSLEENEAHKYYIEARILPDFPIAAPS